MISTITSSDEIINKEKKSNSIISTPISDRPITTASRAYCYVYTTLLCSMLSFMHLSQLLLYPLSFIPGGLREFYWWYIRKSKESFGGRLMIFLGGKTKLELTFNQSINLNDLVDKDENGNLILKFDRRAVWMSNHQGYSDWIYEWILLYYAGVSDGLTIVLKKSLKVLPIGGWCMRLWGFIFLSSWAEDRGTTGEELIDTGKRATKHDRSMALLLYPEGTLVSALTRPKSRAYAEKMKIEDMKNLLIPRSTGLLYCLRTLSTVVPDLSLYDITLGYPGVPAAGYAQSYYTLQSIYPLQQIPPSVHLHIRKFPLASIPIGIIDPKLSSDPEALFDSATKEEKEIFDLWVRERWIEKDQLMEDFYKNGKFVGEVEDNKRLIVKCELNGLDDWLMMASNAAAPYIIYVLFKNAWKYSGLISSSGLRGFF